MPDSIKDAATRYCRRAVYAMASSLIAFSGFSGCTQRTAESTPASAQPDLPRHAIVFAGHSDAARKDYDIWRICPDGSQLASLVALPESQIQTAISPDGNSIIYVDKTDGAYELWMRKFTGGKAENLTNNPANDSSPSWSPDGEQIAFFSNRENSRPELYVMHLESRDLRRLTENDYHDSGGSWSPDGSRIIFTRYLPADSAIGREGAGEVFELTVETGEERQLTELGGYNGGLDYSPDGSRIAFHRSAPQGSEIWIMSADGSDQKQITDTFVYEYSPAWSPDGNWLAIASGTEHDGRGTFDLWLLTPDGAHRRMVSGAANTQMNPKWRGGEHYCR